MKIKRITAISAALLFSAVAVATAENVVTLTEETEAITLADGDVLTGTGGANTHVSIADGASVTLSGVTITAISNDEDHKWAGLTCLGNATITLADGTTNTINGGHYYYPGIYVAQGYTLTIEGNTGRLDASANVEDGQTFGAGIGGGEGINCGNITINGGVINAKGGYDAAAIGGGYQSSYGSITINGGTITAIGESRSAGIGCGDQGRVQYDYGSDGYSIISNITITGGTIIAIGGDNGDGGAGIGVGGGNGECGDITISGGNIKATGGSRAAGIGCGYCEYSNSVCGNITISGGTIEATGGEGAAAIGCGKMQSGYGYGGCRSITITSGVAKLKAVKGTDALDCIGRSVASESACGSVTIGGVTYWNQEYDEYNFISDGEYQNGGEDYLKSENIEYPSIATPSVIIVAATYTGETQKVVVKDGETTLTLNEDYTVTLSEDGYINAGDYTIAITGLGKYANTSADKTFTINPKELTAANVADIASQTYTGESLTPVVVVTDGATTLSEDVDYYVKGPKVSIVDARSYIHTVVGMGNYSGEVKKSFEITKAEVALTAPSANTLTYNGDAQTLVAAGSANGGTLQYSIDGESFTADVPSATNAGEYTVYYRVVGDANHLDVAAQTVNVTISQAEVALTAPSAIENLIYTGEAQALVAAGSANGGTLQYSLDGESFSTDVPSATAAGNYVVSYRVVGDENHLDVAAQTLDVTIAKAEVALTAPSAIENLIYTGEAQALVAAGSANGGTLQYSLDGESFTIDVPSATNAGNYVIYYRVVGDENHLDVAAQTVNVTIAKAEVALTAPSAIENLIYTGDAQTLVAAGSANGGTLQYSLDGESFSTDVPSATNVGEYTVYYRVVGDENHLDVAAQSVNVTIAVNVSALETAVSEATAYAESIANDYAEIATVLNDAIATAQAVLTNADATQSKVNDAANNLQTAVNQAKVDVAAIIAGIDVVSADGMMDRIFDLNGRVKSQNGGFNISNRKIIFLKK